MRVVSQLTKGTRATFTNIGPVMTHWMVSMSVRSAESIRGMARFSMLMVTPMQRVPDTTAAVTSHLFGASGPFTVALYLPRSPLPGCRPSYTTERDWGQMAQG